MRSFPCLNGKARDRLNPSTPSNQQERPKHSNPRQASSCIATTIRGLFRNRAELRRVIPGRSTRRTKMTKPADIDRNVAAASRRRFLAQGSALLGGAVIGGGLVGGEARA